MRRAMHLSPMYRAGFQRGLGNALRFCDDLEGAEKALRQGVRGQPYLLSAYVT